MKGICLKRIVSIGLIVLLCAPGARAEETDQERSASRTVAENVTDVGKKLGEAGASVGKGATALGDKVGKGATALGDKVGKGVKKIGETVADVAQKRDKLFFDPVVVSATRLPTVETRLSNVPSNTTVITANDIRATAARTVPEALQYEEGVNIYNAVGNDVDTSFNLRGFTDNQEIAVIVDGVRVNESDLNVHNLNLLNVYNIDTIELVRGTSSALYGDSVFGGILHITTKQPSAKPFSPFGHYEFGSHRYQAFHNGVSGTLADEHLFGLPGKVKYFFSGARRLYGGYRDNGDSRATFFDGKFGYELEDGTGEVMFYIKYTDQENHNPGELTLPQVEANRQQTVKPLDNRKWENLILSVSAHKTLFDEHIDVSFNAYRRLMDVKFMSTSVVFSQTKEFFTDSTQKGFVSQITYNETLGPLTNSLTGGIEYANGGDNDESFTLRGFGAGAGSATSSNTDKDNTGIYFQDMLTLYEKLIVTVGLRHDEIDYRFDDHINSGNSRTSDFDETTVKVGTVLKPCENIDIFGSFSEAFKTPGKSDLFNTTGWGGNDPTLKPEKADSYEVGVRCRWQDIFAANFTFFHIETFDEIFFDPVTFTSANVGETRRYGVETAVQIYPTDYLDAYFTYTYTDAKIRQTRAVFGDLADSGENIGLVPQNRFTMGVHFGPLQGFNLWLNGIFVGRQPAQSAETTPGSLDPIESYCVFNTRTSYTFKQFEIFCEVTNLFDRLYYTRGIYTGGTFYEVPAPEREIIAGIRCEWG